MKKHPLKKLFTLLLILSIFSASAADAFAASSCADALHASVSSYTKKSGTFKLTPSSRFYIVSETAPGSRLKNTVKLIDAEFAAKKKPSKTPLPIRYGAEEKARDGDIVIRMIPSGYGSQEYALTVEKDKIFVEAASEDGIFYGLRALLKTFVSSGSNSAACCLIRDCPDTGERTVHLDCGRKYFSKTWIKNFIKRMSWQQYNAIELHFSEDQGLRLESKKFPWLAGSYNGDSRFLTQKDMEDICRTAARYHVEVIPSFDTPGHMGYIVKRYKNYIESHPGYRFTYNGKTYSKKTAGFKNISNYQKYKGHRSGYNYLGIDLSNKTARAFASALVDEYAGFFKKQGCAKFNLGGDELLGWNKISLGGKTFDDRTKWNALQHWDNYARKVLKIKNGAAIDTFISYLNTTAKRLEKKGYVCRVWNDEIQRVSSQHIPLEKSIHIVYWSNKFAPLSTLREKGYTFHNALSLWTYYVTTEGGGYKRSNKKDIYNLWNPKSFSDPFKAASKVPASQYAGAYFCIWCDYPYKQTEKEVWNLTLGRTWSSSAKMWNTQICKSGSGTGKPLSYADFEKYTKRLGAFPGFSGSPSKASTLPKASAVKKAE